MQSRKKASLYNVQRCLVSLVGSLVQRRRSHRRSPTYRRRWLDVTLSEISRARSTRLTFRDGNGHLNGHQGRSARLSISYCAVVIASVQVASSARAYTRFVSHATAVRRRTLLFKRNVECDVPMIWLVGWTRRHFFEPIDFSIFLLLVQTLCSVPCRANATLNLDPEAHDMAVHKGGQTHQPAQTHSSASLVMVEAEAPPQWKQRGCAEGEGEENKPSSEHSILSCFWSPP